MRRQRLGIILAVLVSCSSGPPPEGVLSHHDMVRAMKEIYLAEEKVNRIGIPRDSAEKVMEVFRDKLFQKINVQDSVFKVSFDYYVEKPAELEAIYMALLDTLSLEEQRGKLSVGKP